MTLRLLPAELAATIIPDDHTPRYHTYREHTSLAPTPQDHMQQQQPLFFILDAYFSPHWHDFSKVLLLALASPRKIVY